MGFCVKFLVILFSCFMCFSASVQAEEGNNYLSIPDFNIHRVTPENTTNPSSLKKSNISSVIKKTVNIETPKLRTVNKSETNVPTLKTETSEEIQRNPQPRKDSTVPEVSKTVKLENENSLSQTSTNNAADETDSAINKIKINKINEKIVAPLEKSDFEKSNLAKETGNTFLRTISSLFIVLLLILAFAWVYARVKGINPTAILTGKFSEKDLNKFNVLSTSTLGQGKDIHLVEINGKQLVIGSTNNNINLLTEIPAEEIEKLKEKRHQNQNGENNDIDDIEFPEEDDLYYESLEDAEFMDADFYSSKYSKVYKEYLNKKDDKTES
ncbi:MAG: hypothetical protein A2039_07390 [Candidatus Melainabacteria bacterium GWA2_34_9]|nr:MAG: hypothetical protein A2039_07390 [Candidatus Melainabacteria bacterium GWA2_34_9]